MSRFFDRFKFKMKLMDLFRALIGEDIELVLSNGLSYHGKIQKVFELTNSHVYVNLIDSNNMVNIIMVDEVTVITKQDKM